MRAVRKLWRQSRPQFVAIVGGSGAGKSWLTARLKELLGKDATSLSLDDFYRDRSHLTPGRRQRINFDHPRAIDWPMLEETLRRCAENRECAVPCYQFEDHCRAGGRLFQPKAIVLVEGLWLLHRPSLRRLFSCKIFIDCPRKLRLERRLARDLQQRGRTAASICRQFSKAVSPMHQRFVEPQKRQADFIFKGEISEQDVERLARHLRQLIQPESSHE